MSPVASARWKNDNSGTLSRCSNNIHWDGILKEGNEVAGTVSQDFENSEYAAFIRMEKSHGCCRVPFMHWKKTMKV